MDGQKCVKLKDRIPSRRVYLSDIVPTADIVSHVFLGFTQDGQHLISYKIERDVLTLHIWLFRMREKLVLQSSQQIFRWNEGSEEETIQTDYYDSTAVTVYQWPGDDQHLLIFVVPDHPVPDVIYVSAVFFDRNGGHVLEPGPISYSVVGWGQRYGFIEAKDELGLEEVLTPGLLFCDRDHCTFHTGSEIVALSISRPSAVTWPDTSCGRARLISRVLDVETYLGDLIEGGAPEDYVRLTTYELFVFAMRADRSGEQSGLQVDAFVHAVVLDRSGKQSFREFTLTWNVVTDSCQVNHRSEQEKENSHNPCDLLSKESPMVPIVFREMVRSYNEQKVHYLDNQQLVDCQLSLETMSSPTDSTIIELNCVNHSRLTC